ncbi:MAG: hypothetical protein AB7E67_08515 [Xanthobacteraceae bacterium]
MKSVNAVPSEREQGGGYAGAVIGYHDQRRDAVMDADVLMPKFEEFAALVGGGKGVTLLERVPRWCSPLEAAEQLDPGEQ